jgi:aspartate ammonia-lyase
MENAVHSLRVNCVNGITANADRTLQRMLNSLGIVVKERKLLAQEKWDEVFSFDNLVNPKFEQ